MADLTAVLASRDYAEAYLPEDPVLQAARRRGHELGCVPIGSGGRFSTSTRKLTLIGDFRASARSVHPEGGS